MDTVYCVHTVSDYFDAIPAHRFFVCKNLYTAQQILKKEYEEAKKEYFLNFDETYLDEDKLGKRAYVLWSQDCCSLSGEIETQQILDTYNPPARPIRNRLKDLIKKK